MSNRQLTFIGWILFTLSAIGYTIASIGNPWSLFGSLCFLAACVLFIVAHLREG